MRFPPLCLRVKRRKEFRLVEDVADARFYAGIETAKSAARAQRLSSRDMPPMKP
jgi:hypothetical protein